MIKSKEDILKSISVIVGENNSDEAIALIEDVTDTIDDFQKRVDGDGKDYKKLYESEVSARKEDNDNWKKKYVDRFFNPEAEKEIEKEIEKQKEVEELEKNLSFDDLFKV